ncbi:hypothetical protein [Croceivirga radicis]|uniref:hypothetical protein n=1 Tax=Croceivirga radicis TaxID=1929488 RepID=UPI0002F2A0CB|nr:hypothetical protein [Croceivirga radicis]
MSTGKPKKFENLEKLSKALENVQSQEENLTRVYKDKNAAVKKALHFKTKKDQSKLV